MYGKSSKGKKDAGEKSIFKDIFPQQSAVQPEPVARPAPLTAQKPAVTEEQVAALKSRIDALEKAASHAEKRTAENAPAAGTGKPDTELLTRIAGIEVCLEKLCAGAAGGSGANAAKAGLEDFQKKILEGSARVMKHLEARFKELQDGTTAAAAGMKKEMDAARAEAGKAAERLAQALGEHRKAAEQERLLREQLARACGRAEELDKKLAEVCALETESRRKNKTADTEGLEELGRRAGALEKGFIELRNSLGAWNTAAERKNEENSTRIHGRIEDLEKRVAGFQNAAELLRVKGEEGLKLMAASGAKMELAAAAIVGFDPEKFEDGMTESLAELTAIKQSVGEQADRLSDAVAQIAAIAEDYKGRARLMELSIERVAGGNEKVLASALENISDMIAKALQDFMRELQEKNRGQFKALSAEYAGALDGLRQIDSACTSIDYIQKRFSVYESTLRGFVSKVGGERLASLMGVSGISIREQFGSLESMAADLGRESAFLAAAKIELASKAGRVLGDGGRAAAK